MGKLLGNVRTTGGGPGASRILGIRHAESKYVAFLGADDHCLPNRSEADVDMMEADSNVEGVYGAVRARFEDSYVSIPWGDAEVTTLAQPVEPAELLVTLLLGPCGAFHTAGVTVQREVFEKAGLSDEGFVLAQDSPMLRGKMLTHILHGRQGEERRGLQRIPRPVGQFVSYAPAHPRLLAGKLWRIVAGRGRGRGGDDG